jgi:hypothetical protein
MAVRPRLPAPAPEKEQHGVASGQPAAAVPFRVSTCGPLKPIVANCQACVFYLYLRAITRILTPNYVLLPHTTQTASARPSGPRCAQGRGAAHREAAQPPQCGDASGDRGAGELEAEERGEARERREVAGDAGPAQVRVAASARAARGVRLCVRRCLKVCNTRLSSRSCDARAVLAGRRRSTVAGANAGQPGADKQQKTTYRMHDV